MGTLQWLDDNSTPRMAFSSSTSSRGIGLPNNGFPGLELAETYGSLMRVPWYYSSTGIPPATPDYELVNYQTLTNWVGTSAGDVYLASNQTFTGQNNFDNLTFFENTIFIGSAFDIETTGKLAALGDAAARYIDVNTGLFIGPNGAIDISAGELGDGLVSHLSWLDQNLDMVGTNIWTVSGIATNGGQIVSYQAMTNYVSTNAYTAADFEAQIQEPRTRYGIGPNTVFQADGSVLEYTDTGNLDFPITGTFWQSFTAETTANMTGFELEVRGIGASSINYFVYEGEGTAGTVLFSGTTALVGTTEDDHWVLLPVLPTVPLTLGQVYTISVGLVLLPGAEPEWIMTSPGSYARRAGHTQGLLLISISESIRQLVLLFSL